eukprot:gene9164-10137_t
MSSKMELGSLLDLALGQQQEGAVNFKVLHGFLKNMLGHLSISNVEVDVRDFKNDDKDNDETPSLEEKKISSDFSMPTSGKSDALGQYNGAVETRVRGLEDRLKLLDSFAANDEILKWAKGRDESKTKIADMWNFMNMQKRIDATENGIKKISSLVDKILSQLNNVSDLQERMFNMEKKMEDLGDLKQQLHQLTEKIKLLDDAKKIDELLQQLSDLRKKLDSMPVKGDLEVFVQWPQLQTALESGKLTTPLSKNATGVMGGQEDDGTSFQISTEKSSFPVNRDPKAVTTLGKLGKLILEHYKLEEEVNALKSMLDKKANLEDLENLASKDIPEDLKAQLAKLNDDVTDLKVWKYDASEEISKIGTMETSLRDLESAVEYLQKTMKHVVDEHGKKQKQIDDLNSLTSNLNETKMDKDDALMQLSSKADKTDLEGYVSRQRFDTNITRIDDLLKELVDKFRTNDEALNKMIVKLINDLEEKLDRDEFKEFKDYIDAKLKALKAKQKQDPMMDEDPAAAFKKMLQFNCLSCDRPVYFSGSGPMQGFSGMPMQRSNRPYTAYELDQLRMLQKGSLKPEANDFNTYRSCGGSHTSSNPNKQRISAKLNTCISSYEEVQPPPPPITRSEVDIQGQDGKLYKGRVEKSNDEFPVVNRRQQQNGRIKPKSAHAGMRTSNTAVSPASEAQFLPRRPKTAMNRSSTPERSSERSTPERPQTAQFRTPSPDLSNIPTATSEEPGVIDIV